MNIQKPQYDILMQKTMASLQGYYSAEYPPTLLLHSCCAPCSSSVIKRLAQHFKITVFYYNPNIDTLTEYQTRAAEQQHLLSIYNAELVSPYPIDYIEEPYRPEEFLDTVSGLETCPEGVKRCFICYHLRLKKTAVAAAEKKIDFFCSTLSVSPLKNAEKINLIGESLSSETCRWLNNDFKKRNGYLDSIRISRSLGLYRQDYCGCKYSKSARHLPANSAG